MDVNAVDFIPEESTNGTGEWFELEVIASQTPFSVASFDHFEEVLWTGSVDGRVSAYLQPDGRRSVSFRAHETPVQQIIPEEYGVLSLSTDKIAIHKRGGSHMMSFPAEGSNYGFSDCVCASFANFEHTLLAVSHQAAAASIIDLPSSTCVRTIEWEAKDRASSQNPTVGVLSFSGRYLCAGDDQGFLLLADPRSKTVSHSMRAFTGGMTGISFIPPLPYGGPFSFPHTVVTAGMKAGRTPMGALGLIPDTEIRVFDLRTLRPLPSVHVPGSATYLSTLPSFPSTIFVMSAGGVFCAREMHAPRSALSPSYMISSNGAQIMNWDVSQTGQTLACVDAFGLVHQWTVSENLKVCFDSRPSDLPPAEEAVEELDFLLQCRIDNAVDVDDPSYSLSQEYCVGSPGSSLISSYAPSAPTRILRPPRKIRPEILSSVTQKDFVGHTKNPGMENVHVEAYIDILEEYKQKRSKSRMKRKTLSMPHLHLLSLQEEVLIPPVFRFTPIEQEKYAWDEFDFQKYNKSEFTGLENTLPNSYCNVILQLLYSVVPLRRLLQHHICHRQFCLGCELGFLFRSHFFPSFCAYILKYHITDMLELRRGDTAHAGNFLRVFQQLGEASALGLFDTELSNIPVGQKIQSFLRFVFEQLKKETGQADIISLIGMNNVVQLRYKSSHRDITRTQETYSFVVDMVLPDQEPSSITFADVISKSLFSEMSTRAYWEETRSYELSTRAKSTTSLPEVLCVNTAITKDHIEWWQKLSSEDSLRRSWISEQVFAVYDNDRATWKAEPSDSNHDGSVSFELHVIVFRIEDPLSEREEHFVVCMKSGSGGKWVIFNDFSISEVSREEAVECLKWKIPFILLFSRCKSTAFQEVDYSVREINTDVFFDKSLSMIHQENPTFVIPSPDEFELMKSGQFMVALDAEFVALRLEESEVQDDGRKNVKTPTLHSLARVSVVRANHGSQFGVPLMDDYICTPEHVADYLTRYSGVVEGDLDENHSPHHLTSLKNAYLKLRLLVDSGVKIIGHGLKQDFRIINIHVPKDQVIDTVELFRKQGLRKLSLKYLAKQLLSTDIQGETHDSIEDARTALQLYEKYKTLVEDGSLDATLSALYKSRRR